MCTRLVLVVAAVSVALAQAGRVQSMALRSHIPGPEPTAAQVKALTRFFSQRVDHFNPANPTTFNQKYYVNESFWVKGTSNAPLFVVLGGEGPMKEKSVAGGFVSANWAAEAKALLIGIEHRYYGESIPGGSLNDMQYLSSKQALADAAAIITAVKKQYGLTDSKVITFGGSYSGSLSAWMRQKYPHIVDGAVASSAPVLAQVDYPEYLDVVSESLGATCSKSVGAIFQYVQKMLGSSAGRRQLEKETMACTQIQSDYDAVTLVEELTDSISTFVQYNKDNNGKLPFDIEELCKILSNGSPQAALINFVKTYNSIFNVNCTASSWEGTLESLKNTDPTNAHASHRSWYFQTCTEFGYYQTAESPNTPFLKMIDLKYFLDQCKAAFNLDSSAITTAVDESNSYYGGRNVASSKIVLPNGSVDPWHVLGVTKDSVEMPVIYIQGTAHCADLYQPSENDLPELKNARKRIHDLVFQWIAQ